MIYEKKSDKLLRAINAYQLISHRKGPLAKLSLAFVKRRIEFWTIVAGCDIHRDATIPESTRLPHPTGVVVHRDTVIGENCLIMQQVTLGQTAEQGAPTLGENVYVGAGAKILGNVTIGDNARVGANAVVLCDVPENATAVGIPARVVLKADIAG